MQGMWIIFWGRDDGKVIYDKNFLMLLSFGLGIGMAVFDILFCIFVADRKDDKANDGKVADIFAKEQNKQWGWKKLKESESSF